MNSPDKIFWYDSKETEYNAPGPHPRGDTYDSLLQAIISKQQLAAINRTSHNGQSEQPSHNEAQYIPVFGHGSLTTDLPRDAPAEKILQLRHRLEQMELRLNNLETKVSFLLQTHPSSELWSARAITQESHLRNLNEQTSLPAMIFWTMWPIILLTIFNKLNITTTYSS